MVYMDRSIVVAAALLMFLAGCSNASPSNPDSTAQSGEETRVSAELRTVELSSSAQADPSLCSVPSFVSIFDHANVSLDDGDRLETVVHAHIEEHEYPGGEFDYPGVELVETVFPGVPDSRTTVVLLGGSNSSDRLVRIDLRNVASPPLVDGWLVERSMACSPGVLAVIDRSCGSQKVKAEFAEPFERWQSSDIDNYTITYTRDGVFGTGVPETVTVWGGQPERDDELLPVLAVCELFAILDRADRVLTASFDPVLGYPISMSVDPSEGETDDEFALTVIEFLR